MQQTQEDNELLPRIHDDWLTPDEQSGRQLQDVNNEVILRMIQERATANRNVPQESPRQDNLTPEEVANNIEPDSEKEDTPPLPRFKLWRSNILAGQSPEHSGLIEC